MNWKMGSVTVSLVVVVSVLLVKGLTRCLADTFAQSNFVETPYEYSRMSVVHMSVGMTGNQCLRVV